jgi:hypothetical protein
VSFQSNAFQQDALQVGAGADVPAPFSPNQTASAPSISRILLVTVGTSLLCSTLAPTSAQAIPREATLQNAKVTPAVQAFQQHNLLTSTLASTQALLPVGQQHTDNLVQTPRVFLWSGGANIVLPTALPVGQQKTDSAPPTPRILTWDQKGNTLILPTPLPVGQQHTDSSPPTPRIGDIRFARGVDPQAPPADVPLPIGQQHTDSAPVSQQPYATLSSSNQALLATSSQPLPQGGQETANLVQTSSVKVDQPPNLLTTTLAVIAGPLPIGSQHTDSAPPTARIGSILYARGVDPQAAAPPDPLPIGRQQTDSAPVVKNAVWARGSAQLPSLIPPPAAPTTPQIVNTFLPAPQSKGVTSFQFPSGLGLYYGLPDIATSQSEFMFVIRTPAVFNWIPPNVTINLPIIADPLPIGKQQTESAPKWNPPVQGYEAWNSTLYIPPPNPLPIGKQWTNSAPVVTNAVWAQNSFQDPSSIPPPVFVPEPDRVIFLAPGEKYKKQRFVKRILDKLVVFHFTDAPQETETPIAEERRPKRKITTVKNGRPAVAVLEVPISAVESLAAVYNRDDTAARMLARREFEQLLAIYEQLAIQQDEEDVLFLLIHD